MSFLPFLFLLSLLFTTLPLCTVLAQCQMGWNPSGSCQMTGICMDPREQCFSGSVCCQIASQQTQMTTKQNPKTGQMESNWCPMGSYRDGGCSTFCWTPSQTCVNKQDCCAKSNIPTNTNPYNPGFSPGIPGGYNPYSTGYNPTISGGYNPYNPSNDGICNQGQGSCPLGMCQDGNLQEIIFSFWILLTYEIYYRN